MLQTYVEIVIELKKQMEDYDHDDYLKTTKKKLELIRKDLEQPFEFVVFDIDLHTAADRNSYNCIWIGESFDDEDQCIYINEKTDAHIFQEFLRYILREVNNEEGGMRRGLYIQYAYAAITLKGIL